MSNRSILNVIGLSFVLLGTIFVALCLNIGISGKEDEEFWINGRRPIVLFSKNIHLFRFGWILVFLGTILQIIGSI